jgi:hypothetical protein
LTTGSPKPLRAAFDEMRAVLIWVPSFGQYFLDYGRQRRAFLAGRGRASYSIHD